MKPCSLGPWVPFVLAIAVLLFPKVAFAGESAFREIPASGITIVRSWLNEHQQVGETGVCSAFKNASTVPVVRVEFLYSLIAKDGTVLRSVVHEARGNFAPGALIQGESEVTCSTAYGVFYNHGSASVRQGDGSMVASVSQVEFANGDWWHAGPDVIGGVLAQSGTDLHLTRAFSWEPGTSTQECASFENRGSRVVRKIRLMFSHIADDGSDVVDDPFDVSLTPGMGTACRGWSGSMIPTTGAPPSDASPQIIALNKDARLVAWISDEEFTDNTEWHAKPPTTSALAAAAIPNSADFSHAVWWPSGIDVPEVPSPGLVSGVEISKAYALAFADSSECLDVVNRSQKAITHVRFMLSHIASDGRTLAIEPLDLRQSLQPGAAKTNVCRGFDGNVVLASEWKGGRSDSTVVFQGQPTTIGVRVDQVDFADGTTWAQKPDPK